MALRKKQDATGIQTIGPVSMGWLREIGIHSRADLETIGSVEAYRRAKVLHPDRVSLNSLYGLEAALRNIHWRALPPPLKEELRAEAEID